MSDGKSSSYTVVSAEELRRRALAAAEARLSRALDERTRLSGALRAAEQTYGTSDIDAAPGDVERLDPSVVEDLADRMERANSVLERDIARFVELGRRASFEQTTARLLKSLSRAAPVAELGTRSAATLPRATAVRDALAKAEEIFARLPADADQAELERCEGFLAAVGTATSDAGRTVALTAMRDLVQGATERTGLVARNRTRLEDLYRRLDGLSGSDVEATRGLLRGQRLDVALPPDLERQVDAAAEAARRAADRAFALQVAGDVLAELGYEVDASFVATAANEGFLMPLAGAEHGLRVRERDGQLIFNVVRYDRAGLLDDEADERAAAAFCEDFREIVTELGTRGVSTTPAIHFEAGSGHIEVRPEERPWPATTRQRVARAHRRQR